MTNAFNLSQLANNTNSSGQVTLTTGVAGTLPVANGGTGAATLTANNLLVGAGTSAVTGIAAGASGEVLTSNGTTWASAAPGGIGVGQTYSLPTRAYSTTYTNSGTKPIFVTISGSNTVANTTSGISLLVNSVIISTARNGGSGSGLLTNQAYSVVTGIIPVGFTYSVTPTASTLQKWAELS